MISKSQKIVYGCLWALVLAGSAAPLLTLVGRILPQLGMLSLLWEPNTLRSLGTTLGIGSLSLLLALVLGIPASYLLVRTTLPMARFFRTWLLFPYFVPSYLFAIAWVVLALPHVGILNRLVGRDWISIYSSWGLIWVLCNAFLPLLITSLSNGLQAMDPSLEESARVCGASPLRVFWSITLPCQLPIISSAALLYLLLAVSAFGIPAIIGNPAKIYVLTTRIYTLSKMGGLSGADQGFVVSLWLIGLTICLTTLNDRLKQKSEVKLTVGKTARGSRIELGNWKWLGFSYLTLLGILFVALPMAAILLSSFFRVAGDLRWENLSLRNYEYVFNMSETIPAILHSLMLATLGGFLCCLLGFGIAYYRNRTELKGNRWLERLGTFPFSVPGTVVALALIVSYGTGWGISELSLLGTSTLILLAYVSKDIAIAIQSIGPALGQVDKSLDEAGRVCGASPWRVVSSILLPLLFPTLFGVFFLSALPMLSELTMSVLLAGPGTETLGTVIFQLQDYANPLAACSLASLVVLTLALGMGLWGSIRRWRKK